MSADPSSPAPPPRLEDELDALPVEPREAGLGAQVRPGVASGRRRRTREMVQRECRLSPRFSLAELEVVRVAAAVAGLTPTGWVAETAVDVATARVSPPPPALLDALPELLAARSQVRRFGVLVNQAMAKWHTLAREHVTDSAAGGAPRGPGPGVDRLSVAAGAPPPDLLNAVALVNRVLLRLEDAAVAIAETRRGRPAIGVADDDNSPAGEPAGGRA
ncbi:MAG: plasmid mobilization relaxosome protein MobC [Frankiales bacterium]|nr:plasmid mobilization relaxosome protein MobC [Frankiales bacterium]